MDNLHLYSNEELYNIMTKKYSWASKYCYYYIYVFYAVRSSIVGILESILENDRDDCSMEKAYNYLRKYEKDKINFGVVIPTCNRPEAIKYILEYTSISYRRRAVDLIIYDSSDNYDTKNIVESFIHNGYQNVYYKKYSGVFDGFSLDHKIIEAYKEFSNGYDYLWLCRDGLVPVIDEIIEKFIFYKQEKIDCVIVDTKSRNYGLEIEKTYFGKEDCLLFLKEQVTRLQTLGMLIFSKEYALYLLNEFPLTESTYSLWQMAVPFHSFVRRDLKVIFTTRNVFAENIGASKTHFWSKSEKLFEQWAYRWINVVDKLPNEYNELKKECYMVYTIDFHPFSPATIMKMRTKGGLNHRILKKYKKYIPLVTKTPMWYFNVITYTPKLIVKIAQFLAYNNLEFSRKVIKRITGRS